MRYGNYSIGLSIYIITDNVMPGSTDVMMMMMMDATVIAMTIKADFVARL